VTTVIAPDLGRLGAPSQRQPFDDIRLALLDAIVAAKAAGQLDQEVWDTAYSAAMRSLRMRLLAEAEARLLAAAEHSRYPVRRLRALLPDAEAADTLLNRLLAEGMPVERFEGLADDPPTRRARAAALEQAWEGATGVAREVQLQWQAVAVRVANWRRPTAPLWIISCALLVGATVAASWLSGTVTAPRWFRPINEFWWRLWP
jgi:hypothetical protein